MRFHEMTSVCVRIAMVIATLTLVACGSDIEIPPAAHDPAAIQQQHDTFVEAMRPRTAARPLIAVVAWNEGTETTDFLLTHAVLRRADVADVQAIAPRRGSVSMYPALGVQVAQDLASFDRQHQQGADYIIVPAMSESDPAITGWLKQQADRGARIIGVCAGALVVADAGLLDGRRFATHWYYRDELLERHPTAIYVPNQRYVVDGNIATTTGITASVPTMLTLVEAIAGYDKAQTLATELGVDSWSPAHDSSRFGLNLKRASSYLFNKAAFWRDERRRVDVAEGTDDIALAFAADAWSRTGHVTVEPSAAGPVKLRSGIVLEAQPVADELSPVALPSSLKPMQQLDRTLCEIGEQFGAGRREWVMMELEYPQDPQRLCTPAE